MSTNIFLQNIEYLLEQFFCTDIHALKISVGTKKRDQNLVLASANITQKNMFHNYIRVFVEFSDIDQKVSKSALDKCLIN